MEETKIDNLIVHVPTKLKYWEDEMVEADFLGEEKRYHHEMFNMKRGDPYAEGTG